MYKDPPLADFLIVDEIHTVLSTKYSNVFSRNYSYILGLTATVSENKLELLEQYAPICFKLGLVEAQEKGLINSFNIYNVSVPLNPKERYMYKMYDGQFREASGILGSYNRAWNTGMNSFSAAQKFKEDSFHEMYKWAKQFWFTMTKRKQICQLANSKIEAAIKIIEKYPEKKWIIFSKSINFTQKVHTILTEKGIVTSIYHSNLSKKKQKENLELSHKKKCRVICSAEALNTGFDLPDLDAAIVLSGDSSEITAIQQIGRTARYRERKPISLFVNLYAVNTREEVWIRNKYSSLEESKYHFVTLNSFLHGGSTI